MNKTGINAALACCILMVLASCYPRPKDNKRAAFYAIDSLISAQARLLSSKKITLVKHSSLMDKNDKTVTTPADTNAWKKELEIFSMIDLINKPATRSQYKTEQLKDQKSNLDIRAFTATDNLPVRYLKIYHQRGLDKIRKIEAVYGEADKLSLFTGERLLSMEFQQVDNKSVLTSYSIIGGQKMFLDDTVQYTVTASLMIN